MKGIVMEVMAEKVVVLTHSGEFLEVPKPNDLVDVGEEIVLNQSRKVPTHIYRRVASIAAAIILFITGSYGAYGYYNPYGYANVDINPSVEISYNLFNRVIKIEGLNEDGGIIVSKLLNYKFKPLDKVISDVVDRAIEEEYIKNEEENLVLVTITEKGKEIEEDSIYESITNHIDKEASSLEVLVVEGDQETYDKAKKEKISPGKLMLINKALSESQGNEFQDISSKSVKEIMSIIKDDKKEDKQPPGQIMKENNATSGKSDNNSNGNGKEKGKDNNNGKNDNNGKPNDKGNNSNGNQSEKKGNDNSGNQDKTDDKENQKYNNNGNSNSKKEDQNKKDNGNNKGGTTGRHR